MSDTYTIAKSARGYKILLYGEPFLYFRTKRLAKKFLKNILKENK